MAEGIIRENSEDGVELSDESLDSISGGYVLNNGTDYEVIDEKGDVVETIPGTTMASYESARQRARELGRKRQNHRVVRKLREDSGRTLGAFQVVAGIL